VELLPADRIVEILVGLGRFLYVAALVALFYVYLPIVFSFFPWTRGFAEVLFGYVFAPLAAIARAVIGYLPSLFFLLVTFVCVRYFLKVVRIVFQEVRRGRIAFPGFYPEWSEPTYKIVRFFIWAFALVVMFPYLPGSDSPAFKGVSVFLGVLFSLGSSSAIANAVAGVILTYMRPFTAGDRVKIADTVGEVIEKTLLVTRVRTVKNVDVTIPNALTLNSHIVNYSSSAAEHGLVLNTTVTIGYDVPWKKVHELLVAAAKATENVLADPAPFVLQTALGDFSVSYELNAYTDKPSLMVRVYSDLHQNIQDKFNAAGVEIMSPAFTAVRDGNATTVPEENRPKGYQAPRFRLFSKPEPS
jgi:small-conductance mechanosensitive channel